MNKTKKLRYYLSPKAAATVKYENPCIQNKIINLFSSRSHWAYNFLYTPYSVLQFPVNAAFSKIPKNHYNDAGEEPG